jgi:hypothetical protein
MSKRPKSDKSARGNASLFFVAAELCRRDLVALVTVGNTPNTDILCSNKEGTKFVHIQVKTFIPGNRTVSVGRKAEKNYGKSFIWVLAGIPTKNQRAEFVYYVIPSSELSQHVSKAHKMWLDAPAKNGEPHKDNDVRTVHLPPYKSVSGWQIDEYKNRWDIIEDLLS